MSNITRWNPVNEFEDLIDRYNRYFGLSGQANGETEGKDGLLSLTLKKVEPAEPKAIEVEVH